MRVKVEIEVDDKVTALDLASILAKVAAQLLRAAEPAKLLPPPNPDEQLRAAMKAAIA